MLRSPTWHRRTASALNSALVDKLQRVVDEAEATGGRGKRSSSSYFEQAVQLLARASQQAEEHVQSWRV